MDATDAFERNARARTIILSEEFYADLRNQVAHDIADRGRSITEYYPRFFLQDRDIPLLQFVFNKLQREYPELNHIRLNGSGTILIDTRKNTFLRRLGTDYPEID